MGESIVYNLFKEISWNLLLSSCELLARCCAFSVEVAEDLATDVLSLGFFVVHDTVGSGENDVSELSGGEDVVDELLEVLEFEVVSGGDDSALVQSSVQLNDDLSVSLVVNDLEFTDVTYTTRLRERGDSLPCFYITLRNLTRTLEVGLRRTYIRKR